MITAHRAMRILAERLAVAGIGALRFDYPGTGDSGDSREPAEATDWLASVGAAVAAVRKAGALSVVLVGLRMGGVFATAAASSIGDLHGLVLWDPCESGAAFLREERALLRLGLAGRVEESSDTDSRMAASTPYTATTLSLLRELKLSDLVQKAMSRPAENQSGDTRLGLESLALLRPTSLGRSKTQQLLETPGLSVRTADGQDDLFDYSKLAIPGRTIDEIVSWISERTPTGASYVDMPLHDSAEVGVAANGDVVSEHIVRLGPRELLGISTQVSRRPGPLIILTNALPSYHIGPARLWVELSRRLAAEGLRVLRFDDWNVGDSPGPYGLVPPSPYTPDAVGNILAAITATRSHEGGNTALVGLCSAAWSSIMAAHQAPVDSVFAVNPVVWHPRPQFQFPPPVAMPATERPNKSRGFQVRTLLSRALRGSLPRFILWRLARAGFVVFPAGLLTQPLRRGVAVTLMFGNREAADFRRRRGDRVRRRWRSGGVLRLYESKRIDHSLMSQQARDEIMDCLAAWIAVSPSSSSEPA